MRKKDYFGLNNKVPYITDRTEPKFASSATWHISVTPLKWDGRYGRQTVWAARVKCHSVLTNINLTALLIANPQGVPVRIFQLPHCSGRGFKDEKTVSASKVKCPSLLSDFNLIGTACDACAVGATWHTSFTPLEFEGRYARKKCFGVRSIVHFITGRFQPKLYGP
jgi:hypothetical protein